MRMQLVFELDVPDVPDEVAQSLGMGSSKELASQGMQVIATAVARSLEEQTGVDVLAVKLGLEPGTLNAEQAERMGLDRMESAPPNTKPVPPTPPVPGAVYDAAGVRVSTGTYL